MGGEMNVVKQKELHETTIVYKDETRLERRWHKEHEYANEDEAKAYSTTVHRDVITEKKAKKDLKAKMKSAKQKQAENAGKRYAIINGEEIEVTEKDKTLDALMSEESIEEIEKEIKEARLKELEEKYGNDPKMYAHMRAHLLDDDQLMEENQELYEEMKEYIDEIKQISDVEMRKQEMMKYRNNYTGAQSMFQLLFDRFFMKDYNEVMKTKLNTEPLSGEDSLKDVLSNKLGMIQNKTHRLYLESLRRLFETESNKRKADNEKRKENAKKRIEEAEKQHDQKRKGEAEKEYDQISKEDYSGPVARIVENATYQDFLNAAKKGISVDVFWKSLMAKSK